MSYEEKRKGARECILYSLITASLAFLYFIVKDQGFLLICDDFDVQQIPFAMALNNSIKKGAIDRWIWNYDLGNSTIQGFSFYNLGSPFFWMTLPFPASFFPYLTGLVYVIKYIFAAVTAYYYVSYFVKNLRTAVFGALLYAFSGFQTVNLEFYHFHDVVAFFPLLLSGLEEVMRHPSEYRKFVLAVFVNALLNYYFFVQEVVFLGIYFLFRFTGSGKCGFIIKSIGKCILYGAWGTGMAAILFVPNALYILQSPRLTAHTYLYDLFGTSQWFLYVIKGIILPGEAMSGQSSIFNQDFQSVGCYLPMVGISCFYAYTRARKDWLTRIIVFLLAISFMPIVSMVFTLFSEHNMRWWYMLVLMLALSSAIAMDQKIRIDGGAFLHLAISAVFYLLVRYMPWTENYFIVFNERRLFIYTAVSIVGILTTIVYSAKGKLTSRSFLVGVCVFSAVTMALTLHVYRTKSIGSDHQKDIQIGEQLKEIDGQYRYNTPNNMYALPGEGSASSSFSSTISQGSREFDDLFDFYQGNHSMFKGQIPGLSQLLGLKWLILPGVQDNSVQSVTVEDETWSIIERGACPIGYAVDNYITIEDLKKYDVKQRGYVLLSAAVINSDDEGKVSMICSPLLPDQAAFDDAYIDERVRRNTEKRVLDFTRDKQGFSCRTQYKEEKYIYFSVPYDAGWRATIDGNPEEIINSGGMMLLRVSSGAHQISFTYHTPGYRLGIVISLLSFAIFVATGIIKRRGKQARESRKRFPARM